jgi:hypothetical protein
MTSRRGLLENRAAVIGGVIFFLSVSAWSWLTVTRYERFPHDPIHIFGVLFSVFITVSIAYRSPFWADRVVFGAAAAASLLIAVTVTSLSPLAMFAVNVACAFMWTIAGLVSLIVLARGSRASTPK